MYQQLMPAWAVITARKVRKPVMKIPRRFPRRRSSPPGRIPLRLRKVGRYSSAGNSTARRTIPTMAALIPPPTERARPFPSGDFSRVRASLCANMDETLPPSEFRVEGGEELGDEYPTGGGSSAASGV
jgi:hypothetical protein